MSDFPFITPADRSVALSAMLTALDRRSLPTAPLHAFTSPAAGTGKSLLVDIFAMLATGRLMPVISQGRTEEELEKRLGAALLAGDAAISIDNCEHPLAGGFLCQTLTQQTLNIRLLGFSKNVETPVNAALCATGNNLAIAGDLVRRTLLCSLDAQCERPELRTFETDVIETIRATRGQLVTAALTILRAWLVSGERMKVSSFGSFDHWSRRIREALIWLGQDDPCNTVTKVRAADPTREALLAIVAQWKQHLGIQSAYTAQEVINRATVNNDFHIALLNVAAAKSGGNVVSNKRLGWWLKNVEGKIVHLVDEQDSFDLVLKKEGTVAGYSKWQLHDAIELRKS